MAAQEDVRDPQPPSAPNAPVAPAAEQRQGDRRSQVDRRSQFDRRRGPGRRRTDYRRDAEEGHMNDEQLAFILAMDEYKRANNRPFPTWTEVLDIFLYLGYRKVAPLGEFKLTKGRQTPDPKAKRKPPDQAGAADPSGTA